MGQKLGVVPLWERGAGSPSSTMWPGPRPTAMPSGILNHPAIWPQQIWAENLLGAPPFGGGGAGSPSNTMLLGLRPTSLPSGSLIHPAIWPQQIWAKHWGLCPLLVEGELGPHLTQCGQGRGHFYAGCPSCHNPPTLSSLEIGTRYAGLHTQWLG